MARQINHNGRTYNIPTEEQTHIDLVKWLRLKKIPHFHPRNEGKHHVAYMKKSKMMGLYSGVPDLVVFAPGRILFIELKREKKILKSGKLSTANSKVSDNQKEWVDTINLYDYAECRICYGLQESIDFVQENL